MKSAQASDSAYIARPGIIRSTRRMTRLEKFFEITLPGQESLNHEPGQFVMVSVPGVGEAPISVASSPAKKDSFELVVRNAGAVSAALHALGNGDVVGIRGPFGKGFPTGMFKGRDLLLVSGGLGIVPLRSLINFVIDNRGDFGKVTILLGCKTPQDMLFGDEVGQWVKRLDINCSCTVDRSDPDWKGNVGLITALIPGVSLEAKRTFAVIVGPPIMYKFVILELLKKEIPARQIILSLERHMKCGMGKCGHCQIGEYYCCQDGPVFSYDRIQGKPEAL